jgi:hypothetical protein
MLFTSVLQKAFARNPSTEGNTEKNQQNQPIREQFLDAGSVNLTAHCLTNSPCKQSAHMIGLIINDWHLMLTRPFVKEKQ